MHGVVDCEAHGVGHEEAVGGAQQRIVPVVGRMEGERLSHLAGHQLGIFVKSLIEIA